MIVLQKLFYNLSVSICKRPGFAKRLEIFARSNKSKFMVKPFAKIYKISNESLVKNIELYDTLHDFFTREIDLKTRPIDRGENSITSPVDGVLKDFGCLTPSKKLIVKGKEYSAEELIGNKIESGKDNYYMVFYLSPTNYHRFHAPINGSFKFLRSLGTSSYPVNDLGLNLTENLFNKNFRSVFEMNSNDYLIAVGAMNINSVSHTAKSDFLDKGEELGYFSFGSTVILVFTGDHMTFSETISKELRVKLGEVVAFKK